MRVRCCEVVEVARLWRLRGCEVAMLRGCKVVRLRGCEVAKLRGCEVARLPRY